MSLVFVIDEYLVSEGFVLQTEGDDFWRDDGLVAEVWIVFEIRTVLEEPLPLIDVVDREEVPQPRLFELGLLVFLLPPVVTTIQVVLRTQHLG